MQNKRELLTLNFSLPCSAWLWKQEALPHEEEAEPQSMLSQALAWERDKTLSSE